MYGPGPLREVQLNANAMVKDLGDAGDWKHAALNTKVVDLGDRFRRCGVPRRGAQCPVWGVGAGT